MKRLILIAGLIVSLAACNKAPEACIDNGQTTVTTGTPVNFTSCSKHTMSQEWFMSGPVGAPENTMGWSDAQFSHTFTIPGTYVVTLRAYSKFSFMGDMSEATQSVTVQ
ncbi:MAG: hypothetical protein IPM77_05840 [Crocinitomicaceae bacterium]|nr:hypothetical protein [Crocinitomicaceae bacterium]